MSKDLYTTVEAAELLDVTPARVRQMVAREEIPSVKMGRDRFITAAAIADAQQRKTKPGPTAKPKANGGAKPARKRAAKKGSKK
jgi:excisionase family DNA binding protein